MKYVVLILLFALLFPLHSQVRMAHAVGTGARAQAMGNNQIAAVNDISALYWNPAALSFLPVREFQVSLDFLSQTSESVLYGSSDTERMQRVRLGNIGILHSVPTTRGGFSLAGLYHSPVLFDDVLAFDAIIPDNALVKAERDYRTSGGLRYWTGGFGVQIAEGLGAGGAISLVGGSQRTVESYLRTRNGIVIDTFQHDFSRTIASSYLGYDARLGIIGDLLTNRVQAGLLLVFPQVIRFTENIDTDYPTGRTSELFKDKGLLLSSFNGGLGISARVPLMTVAADVHVRAPYGFVYPSEIIPESSSAGRFKVGAGLGVEIPVSHFALRAAYGMQEFDPHVFVVKYDNQDFYWSDDGLSGEYVSTVSAGFGYISGSVHFEAGYSLQFWEMQTLRTLIQNNELHRLSLSLALRF